MCGFILTKREGLVSFTISAQLEIGTEHLRSSFPPKLFWYLLDQTVFCSLQQV